ncbi:MAG: hypothetical protein ACRCYV_00460 [Aeromonas sp.]
MYKMICFGTGGIFDNFSKLMAPFIEILAVTDNAYKDEPCKKGYRYIAPQSLNKISHDFIVICSDAYTEIIQNLKQIGVPLEKIVAFNGALFDVKTANRWQELFNGKEQLSSAVFGMSYAGSFLVKQPEHSICNFVSAGQDLELSVLL